MCGMPFAACSPSVATRLMRPAVFSPQGIFRQILLPALVAGTFALASPLLAATAKEAKRPPSSAKKPAIQVDSTPVSQGGKAGLVMTYADVLEPAQKAVVSVYSTKIIKEDRKST